MTQTPTFKSYEAHTCCRTLRSRNAISLRWRSTNSSVYAWKIRPTDVFTQQTQTNINYYQITGEMCKIKSFIYPSYLVVTLLQDLFLTQAGVRTLPSWHLCDWQAEWKRLQWNKTKPQTKDDVKRIINFCSVFLVTEPPKHRLKSGGSQLCGIPRAFDQKLRVTASFQHRVQDNSSTNADRSSSFNINNPQKPVDCHDWVSKRKSMRSLPAERFVGLYE